MKKAVFLFLFCIFLAPATMLAAEANLTVNAVRFASYPAFTRIVFELETPAPHVLTKSDDGTSLMLTGQNGSVIVEGPLPPIHDEIVNGVEVQNIEGKSVFVIRLSPAAGSTRDFVLQDPDRLVLDISKSGTNATPGLPAGKQAVVVLDAGHGGQDTGIGAAQGYEKTATLSLALAVRDILEKNKRITVVLTRKEDKDLSLDERAVIANKAGAVVFVSLHGAPGTGVQVFTPDVITITAASPQSSGRDFLGYETSLEQREKAWGSQQSAHVSESSDLARMLARQFERPETAQPIPVPLPLAELKAVDAGAVMVEFGLVEKQDWLAQAVAGGIVHYVRADR